MIYATSAILLMAASVLAYTPDALKDQITSLPGIDTEVLMFNQFSGYLNIDEATGKNIHYWFVEAEESPETAPVVMWTNGGPGCSGLIGFFTEMGPVRVNADNTLSLNEWRWNKIANMLYLEQPAGVGFSYATDVDAYQTGDQQAAIDNYITMQRFLDRFPQYRANDLHITSESYGGHYIPQLATKIVEENANVNSTYQPLNFKGFAVGNPYTDEYSGTGAMLDTFWGHQLIAGPTYEAWQAKCLDPTVPRIRQCEILMVEMNMQIGNLNPYALDYPVCVEDSSRNGGRMQRLWLQGFLNHNHESLSDSYEPCGDDYATNYLNTMDVKRAIHVDLDIPWSECSYRLRYDYADEAVPQQELYVNLLANSDIKMLVYSGDDDSVCATIGTQAWIYDLGYETSSLWKTWTVNDQVAGYSTIFDTDGVETESRLRFMTVHGAGHEVPTYKPEQGFLMFQAYLENDYSSLLD